MAATDEEVSSNWAAYGDCLSKAIRLDRHILKGLLITVVAICFFSFYLTLESPPSRSSRGISNAEPTAAKPEAPVIRPDGVKVYALVPFGRPDKVEVLHCYLERNLVRNGGWLDGVRFPLNTGNQDHIRWIQHLASAVPEYETIELDGLYGVFDFFKIYQQSLMNGRNIYIKIDDDITWLSDNAISEVVEMLLAHPEAFAVSTNLLNSVEMPWLHHRLGAIHSYLPEASPPRNASPESYGPTAWRASALPTYDGPFKWSETPIPDSPEPGEPEVEINSHLEVPYPNHRWLPFRDNDTHLPFTPIWYGHYGETMTPGFLSWEFAVQQHYSLLENIEKDTLDLYDFGNQQGIWNMRYHHSNLNFVAGWADDFLRACEMPNPAGWNDEWFFSMQAPRVLKKQFLIATKSLAAHFSHSPQGGVAATDVLSRYRAYAKEMICSPESQVQVATADAVVDADS